MARRFGQLLLVGTLILAVGGHWIVLQSVAWTSMMISYSQHASLREALQKTFDGRHPCTLCKLVTKGQTDEKKQTAQNGETKLDFFCELERLAVPPPEPSVVPPLQSPAALVRAESPPTPPPRSLHG
jgi:hypothetical protein